MSSERISDSDGAGGLGAAVTRCGRPIASPAPIAIPAATAAHAARPISPSTTIGYRTSYRLALVQVRRRSEIGLGVALLRNIRWIALFPPIPARPAQHDAGLRAGVFALLEGDDAVDQH